MSEEWITYADAADRLGITAEAVRHRARRLKWRTQPGNDGKTLVLTDVPQGACPNCGSRVYKPEVIQRVESLMKGKQVSKAI